MVKGLLILVAACSPPPRIAADAASADATGNDTAPAAFCGDGHLDQNEFCDAGPLNGTDGSLCTAQCLIPVYVAPPAHAIAMPGIIDAFVELSPYRIAMIIDGMPGIQIASDIHPETFFVPSRAPAIQRFAGSTQALSIAAMRYKTPPSIDEDSALWTEVSSDGAPHLYFSIVSDGSTNEIPYPFADGSGGHLVNNQGISPVLVDVSKTTGELLVAVITARSRDDIHITPRRFPALGQLGAAVASRSYPDLVANPNGPFVHRFVQFFPDTSSYALIDVLEYSDPYALAHEYQIELESHGAWPFPVADGDQWQEAIVQASPSTADPALTHPQPFAILTTAGDIYMWQFDHSPDLGGESLVPRFAHVQPGTAAIDLLFFDPSSNGLWTLQPDGHEVILMDGDITSLSSTSLMPVDRQILSGSHHSSKPPPGGEWGYFSSDNLLFRLL